MKFAENSSSADVNGVAALAIIKMLLEILQKKQLLSDEEIDIILNCAEAEVDIDTNTDVGERVAEAKILINNLMKASDDTTRSYDERTKS